MKVGELEVRYNVKDGIDEKIDDAIAKALKPLGYERWASGINLKTRVRDIAFDTKNHY